MSNLPPQTSPVYCTDEDILVYAGGDFALLCPAWQAMASGADGTFASVSPWTLTSGSIDFAARGVRPSHIVLLTTPKNHFPGGGQFFAVDSVAGHDITLRRAYKGAGVGQPPGAAGGLTGVTFAILTLDPQIAEASYDLKQRFAIDDHPAVGMQRASSFIYDPQVLRMATVYSVLAERYVQESRSERGDFEKKAVRFHQKLGDAIARVQIRFGPQGGSLEPTTIFSTRLSR